MKVWYGWVEEYQPLIVSENSSLREREIELPDELVERHMKVREAWYAVCTEFENLLGEDALRRERANSGN